MFKHGKLTEPSAMKVSLFYTHKKAAATEKAV
jgi:hypothetical protein